MSTTEAPLKAKYRTVDVQAVIQGLPEIPKDVITHAAFGTLDDRLWEILTDDLWIEDFAEASRLMVTDLYRQIEETIEAERSGLTHHDQDWMRRVTKVKGRCDVLCCHLDRKARAKRQRGEKSLSAALLAAIRLHRATVRAEYTPTPADEELWKVLS